MWVAVPSNCYPSSPDIGALHEFLLFSWFSLLSEYIFVASSWNSWFKSCRYKLSRPIVSMTLNALKSTDLSLHSRCTNPQRSGVYPTFKLLSKHVNFNRFTLKPRISIQQSSHLDDPRCRYTDPAHSRPRTWCLYPTMQQNPACSIKLPQPPWKRLLLHRLLPGWHQPNEVQNIFSQKNTMRAPRSDRAPRSNLASESNPAPPNVFLFIRYNNDAPIRVSRSLVSWDNGDFKQGAAVKRPCRMQSSKDRHCDPGCPRHDQ